MCPAARCSLLAQDFAPGEFNWEQRMQQVASRRGTPPPPPLYISILDAHISRRGIRVECAELCTPPGRRDALTPDSADAIRVRPPLPYPSCMPLTYPSCMPLTYLWGI
eukprot:COSAG05_NODE_130_length_17165_cov_154.623638_28_plen_108_part_00